MNTTTVNPAQVERLVDENDLVCAGCFEQVGPSNRLPIPQWGRSSLTVGAPSATQ